MFLYWKNNIVNITNIYLNVYFYDEMLNFRLIYIIIIVFSVKICLSRCRIMDTKVASQSNFVARCYIVYEHRKEV